MNLKSIKAGDIMTEIVVLAKEDALVKEVVHLMLRDRISGVPIINHKEEIIGILTLTDLFKLIDKLEDKGNLDFVAIVLQCKDFKVSEIMTKDVFSVSPETSLEEIIRFILQKNIHTFPVVKENKLLGIVGRHDVLNAVFTFS